MGTTWIVTKILWMRKHEPDLLAKTARFVQNHDLVLRAFGADDFYTDLCCAVFYGVWDVRRADWNLPLLERLGLRPEMFGRPTPPGTQVGTIEPGRCRQERASPPARRCAWGPATRIAACWGWAPSSRDWPR